MTRKDILLWVLSATFGVGVALLLTAYAKPAPVSTPLPTPTSVTPSKGIIGPEVGPHEGYLYPGPVPSSNKPRDRRLAGRQSQEWGLPESPEIPWGNRAIFPDGQTILLSEPEFAVTFWSVMQQESGFRPEAQNWATVAGVTYEVAGCLQLLLDPGMLALIAEMGYTRQEMYDCPKNVLVAQEYWRRDMERTGRPWRLWVARPQYRADGQSGKW